ncbi:YidB family protein [Granulicella sp. S156]|uniref:YidB family protein n=1 Tax=Granulicella sp. S156 TaxID=1747224 RepID=UPI00131BD471|nr:YidB family protein [Granulicella sp. S156]
MGLLDSLEGMAASAMTGSGSDQAKVAGGLMQVLQEHPEGVQAVLNGFQNNGMAGHVAQWASGELQTATPDQVQAGLGGTGLIEATAEKAGVSPEVAKTVLASVMPMVISHFAPNGQAPEQSQFSGLAGQLMSKFL